MPIFKNKEADELWEKILSIPLARLIVGLGIGLGCLIVGVSIFYKANLLHKQGVAAECVVVSVREEYKAKSGLRNYYPTVEYKDTQGVTYQIETSSKNGAKIGDKYTILYLPNKPKTADLKDSIELTLDGPPITFAALLIFGLIGWAAVVYNIYFMVRYKRIL